MAGEDVNVKFGGSIEGLQTAVKQAEETVGALTGPLTELQKSFGEIGEAFAAAFAVEKIVEFIEHITEAGAAVEHMSQQLGLSAEQVGAFGFAAGAMGISSEAAGLAMERLERNMATASAGTGPAAAAFKALGISVTDAEGHLKTLDQILPEIADKFEESANGPEKTAIAIDLFGRAGAQMIPFLNQGRAGLDEFNKVAQDTGSIITTAMAEGMEKTAISTYTLGKAADGVGLTLYEAFKPAIDSTVKGLIDLAESFNNGLKSSEFLHAGLTVLVVGFDAVISTITVLSAGLQQVWQAFMATVDVFVEGARTIAKVLEDAFTGNFSKIQTDFAAGMDRMVDIVKERGKKMAEAGAEAAKAIAEQFSNIGANGVDTSGGGAEHESEKPKLNNPGDQGASQSRLAQWRDQLDQKLMAEKNYFADSKAEELAFWQSKLGLTTQGSQEQLAVERNIYTLSKAIAVQKRTETDAIAKEDSDSKLQIAKIGLQQQRDELTAEVDAHKITAAQKVDILKDLQNQEYQLDLQALQDELSTLSGQPAAYQKVYDQILVLKAKHNADMAALDRQAADVQKQQLTQMTQTWEKALQPIDNAFHTSIQGMIQGTTTFTQAFSKLFQSVVFSAIDDIEKMVTKWIAGELAKTAASVAGDEERTASDTAANATSLTGMIGKIIASITGDAAETGAGVTAFLAPYIGPAAIPEGVTAELSVMNFIPMLTAAGGAWDLPADMTVGAHARESILPASIATPMRDFFTGGGAAAQGGGGDTFNISVPLTVSAMDGQSVTAHANQYAPIYARAIMRHIALNPSARGKY